MDFREAGREVRFGSFVAIAALAVVLAACSNRLRMKSTPKFQRWERPKSRHNSSKSRDRFRRMISITTRMSLKYKVLKVHRGNVPEAEILVAQYNPLKPREQVQDDVSGKVGGHVTSFRAGDVHRMALESPLDHFWMGGIVDKYFATGGTRYWAVWTNPGAK